MFQHDKNPKMQSPNRDKSPNHVRPTQHVVAQTTTRNKNNCKIEKESNEESSNKSHNKHIEIETTTNIKFTR